MHSNLITLTEHNGYFAAKESLATLKAGRHLISVTNSAGKLVGFQLQNLETEENLEVFTLEPGATKEVSVEIGPEGVRYRCPLNPTPWYDVKPMA